MVLCETVNLFIQLDQPVNWSSQMIGNKVTCVSCCASDI